MSLTKAPEPAVGRAPSYAITPPRKGLFLTHTAPDPRWRPRHGRARRMLLPALTGVGTLGAAAMLHTVDPREPGHYPTCPLLAITGLYCPGCGAMRALASLTDGNVPAAFGFNPLAVLAFVALLGIFGVWAARQWRGTQKLTLTRPWVTVTLTVLVVAFWVVRNLPGMSWLSPA